MIFLRKKTRFNENVYQSDKKLEFLIQALIKTSRLETGVIELNLTMLPIYDTIAEALGGIIFKAEKKKLM